MEPGCGEDVRLRRRGRGREALDNADAGAVSPGECYCPACGSSLVHPIDWEEVAADNWRLELRCPNCEWVGGAVYERRVVEQLDEELERGMETIVRDLRHLAHANMEEEIERFMDALRADAILPEDF